jgi:hypothetical protein
MTKKTLSLALALTFGIQTLGPVTLAASDAVDDSAIASDVNRDALLQTGDKDRVRKIGLLNKSLDSLDRKISIVEKLAEGIGRVQNLIRNTQDLMTPENMTYVTDIIAACFYLGHHADGSIQSGQNSRKLMAQSAATVIASAVDLYLRHKKTLSFDAIAEEITTKYKDELITAISEDADLNKMGISINDAQNTFEGLIDGFHQLGDKMKGQQDGATAMVANTKNISTILAGLALASNVGVHYSSQFKAFNRFSGGNGAEAAATKLAEKAMTAAENTLDSAKKRILDGQHLTQHGVAAGNILGNSVLTLEKVFSGNEVQEELTKVLGKLDKLLLKLTNRRVEISNTIAALNQ